MIALLQAKISFPPFPFPFLLSSFTAGKIRRKEKGLFLSGGRPAVVSAAAARRSGLEVAPLIFFFFFLGSFLAMA